jgi:oligoendopeptidase F
MVVQNKAAASELPEKFENLDVSDFSQLEPIAKKLLDQPIDSPGALDAWLAAMSAFSAAIDEFGSRKYIDKSCHTDDEAIEKAYLHFVENIEPKLKPVFFELQKKYLASPHRSGLTDTRHAMLARKWQADVDVYDERNVAIETQITKIVNEYDKISGAMTVEWEGKTLTLQQLGRYQEETDRAVRQRAFEAAAERRMQDTEKVAKLFDDLMPLRQKVAENAGLPDYRRSCGRRSSGSTTPQTSATPSPTPSRRPSFRW